MKNVCRAHCTQPERAKVSTYASAERRRRKKPSKERVNRLKIVRHTIKIKIQNKMLTNKSGATIKERDEIIEKCMKKNLEA